MSAGRPCDWPSLGRPSLAAVRTAGEREKKTARWRDRDGRRAPAPPPMEVARHRPQPKILFPCRRAGGRARDRDRNLLRRSDPRRGSTFLFFLGFLFFFLSLFPFFFLFSFFCSLVFLGPLSVSGCVRSKAGGQLVGPSRTCGRFPPVWTVPRAPAPTRSCSVSVRVLDTPTAAEMLLPAANTDTDLATPPQG